MAELRYIQVILPLKLDWEPYYKLPEGMEVEVGSRIRVVFSGAFYVGCVSAVDVQPDPEVKRILTVEALEDGLPAITPEEIRFWKEIAGYYLCSVGEVYKQAYPAARHHKSRLTLPESLPQKGQIELTPFQKSASKAIEKAFKSQKTVLLNGVSKSGKSELSLKLALDTLEKGRSVLFLVPDIDPELEKRIRAIYPSLLTYQSKLSTGKKKQVAEKLRTGEPCLVLGTRISLFLPYHNLGLVVVDSEHDSNYKQDSPAPRYHARESAIMLAGIHGAHVLLTSATPSLESIYNAQCGRFTEVKLTERFNPAKEAEVELIDTGAEWRKRGMAGCFSLKLLARMRETLQAGGQVLLLGPRRSYTRGRQMEDEALEYFPDARISILDMGPVDGEYDIYIGTIYSTRGFHCQNLKLVALLMSDSLLARQDFRADEHAFQVLEQFRSRCERFVIQTREPNHPVFSQLGEMPVQPLLDERRLVGYPPYTRLIKVSVHDKSLSRLDFMSHELASVIGHLGANLIGPYAPAQDREGEEGLREMHLLLPRDRELVKRKAAMAHAITAFEQDRKYSGHIVIDVDPV